MKKALLACSMLFLAGCNIGTTSLLNDGIDYQKVDIINSTKKAEGCDTYIPLLLLAGPTGKESSSVVNIAKNNGITNVTYVDVKTKYVFPVYYMKCYVVYGN